MTAPPGRRPSKITNYTAQGPAAIYPTVAEKTTFDIKLAFVEVANVLFIKNAHDRILRRSVRPEMHGNAF